MTNQPLFLGLGSPHGDDQAGWLVIESLHQCGILAADAIALSSPDEIWHRSMDHRELILCDAAVDPGGDGIIQRWHWPEVPLPQDRHGTHDLPLEEVLSVGRTLGLCPAEVVLWTISGSRFAPGAEVSTPVRQAAVTLANSLYQEFRHA